MRDCDNCANYKGGCVSWKCKFVPNNKEFKDGYKKAIDDFSEEFVKNLHLAVGKEDVESIRNLITDIAKRLKEGVLDE